MPELILGPPPAGVDLDISILDENDALAGINRARMDRASVRCVNMMSSPGSGKTTLLERTLSMMSSSEDVWEPLRIAIMEGDMTTELDADRLRACGAPVVAITTGRSCHLESDQIARGLDALEPLDRFDLAVIENVGNLICPAAYDLGEHARVVLVAITEGEDKPLKYPIMFHGADCVVLTKLDLAPYLKIDIDRLKANVRQVNGNAEVMAVSAESGQGMDEWIGWLRSRAASS
ncbi:MAG: hydrogenase nickel incorporation protein HypB [Capsulimonadaceae bacterium]